MAAYFEAKMRSSAKCWSRTGRRGLGRRSRSAEVVRRCGDRGVRVMTVGTAGEALRLVGRETTQLGQKLTIEGGRQDPLGHIPLIGAYRPRTR
jgi:UDP-N-acetylmuramoyl-L-alanyl-D-glutamate--2,6-diaminopimelate ligase